MEILHNLYLNPDKAESFGGVEQLFRAAKKLNPKITKKVVLNFLHSLPSYTQSFPARWKFPRARIVSFKLNWLWMVDTAHMESLGWYNSGFKYIVCVVDVLSQMLYCQPIKKKTAVETTAAFEKIIKLAGTSPKNLCSDEGTEYQNSTFQALIEEYKINYYTTLNKSIKGSNVERAIRTLKQRLYKFLLFTGKWRWIDNLQEIVTSINNTPSRIIKLAPSKVTTDNEQEVFLRRYHSQKRKYKPFKFEINDFVRTRNYRTAFTRGFLPNFSGDIFQVSHRHSITPHIYELTDPKDKIPLNRGYYSQELVKSVGEGSVKKVPKRQRKL